MKSTLALVVLLVAGTAAAQPVKFQVLATVPVGQKPQLRFDAGERLTDLVVELTGDDGTRVSWRRPELAQGASVMVPIGSGAPGKVSYQGTLSAQIAGQGAWKQDVRFETLVRQGLKITYDAEHLDLDQRVLQFQVSEPAEKAELVVFGEDGKELGRGQAAQIKAGTWIPIGWTQPAGARVMKMRLRVVAAGGAASTVELVPWSVIIEHDDVNFASDSAVIAPGEAHKLDASLAKIATVVKRASPHLALRLYIAGHTDTVGKPERNRKLSRDRAAAIGKYFRKKGLALPVTVAGFGEDVLAVDTPDETDQPANRRADYVLGPASGAPPFRGKYQKARAEWRELGK